MHGGQLVLEHEFGVPADVGKNDDYAFLNGLHLVTPVK
jgi:hypothetical protein